MSLSTFNYIIYIFCSESFNIDNNLTFIEIAFEFIYYTFSLMISYGSDSIKAITIFSKIVQMVEIVFSYVLLGTVIITLLTKYINKNIDMEKKE